MYKKCSTTIRRGCIKCKNQIYFRFSPTLTHNNCPTHLEINRFLQSKSNFIFTGLSIWYLYKKDNSSSFSLLTGIRITCSPTIRNNKLSVSTQQQGKKERKRKRQKLTLEWYDHHLQKQIA